MRTGSKSGIFPRQPLGNIPPVTVVQVVVISRSLAGGGEVVSNRNKGFRLGIVFKGKVHLCLHLPRVSFHLDRSRVISKAHCDTVLEELPPSTRFQR